jgi:hypothetical protein
MTMMRSSKKLSWTSCNGHSSKYPDLTIDLGEGFTPLAEDERVFVFRSADGWARHSHQGLPHPHGRSGYRQRPH